MVHAVVVQQRPCKALRSSLGSKQNNSIEAPVTQSSIILLPTHNDSTAQNCKPLPITKLIFISCDQVIQGFFKISEFIFGLFL